jgi:hypothetical protein
MQTRDFARVTFILKFREPTPFAEWRRCCDGVAPIADTSLGGAFGVMRSVTFSSASCVA